MVQALVSDSQGGAFRLSLGASRRLMLPKDGREAGWPSPPAWASQLLHPLTRAHHWHGKGRDGLPPLRSSGGTL